MLRKLSFIFAFFYVSSAFSDTFALRVYDYFDGKKFENARGKYLVFGRGQKLSWKTQPVKNAKVISLEGKVLMPGFIDLHQHLLFENPPDKFFYEALSENAKLSDQDRLELGLKNSQQMIQAGFTSILDLGNSGDFLDQRLSNKMAKLSKLPSLYYSGPGLTVGRGQFAHNENSHIVEKEYSIIGAKTDIEKLIKIRKKQGSHFIKVYVDNDPSIDKISKPLFKKIIELSLKHNIPVTVHSSFPNQDQWIFENKFHSVHHVYELEKELAKKLAGKEIWLVPTDIDKFLRTFIKEKRQDEGRLKELFSNQVRLVFGSDVYHDLSKNGLTRGKQALHSLFSWSEAGLPLDFILRACTSSAADYLDVPRIGSVQEGFVADLTVWDGEILRDFSRITQGPLYVFKSGELIQ